MSRVFSKRQKGHQDETERVCGKITQATERGSESKQMKSTVVERVVNENHIPAKNRRIREYILDQKKKWNQLEKKFNECGRGAYQISLLYDQIIERPSSEEQDQRSLQFEKTSLDVKRHY